MWILKIPLDSENIIGEYYRDGSYVRRVYMDVNYVQASVM